MFNKTILASAFLFSLSANATVITNDFSPTLKSQYPLQISKPDRSALDSKNYAQGYLASYAQAHVDISQQLLSVNEVCFELDTQYSGSGSTPGSAGVDLYSYFVYAGGSRGNNSSSGRGSSLANPTFSSCFNLAEGFTKSFISEGKIAFTPYTTNTDVVITDVRVSVTGLSKISGDIVTIDAAQNVLGAGVGEVVTYQIESGVTYSVSLIDNNTQLNTSGGSYSTLGISFLAGNGDRTLKTLKNDAPVYIESTSDLSLFLIGNEATGDGVMNVNIKKVNLD
ncbi:hypothetical protein BGP78_10020 [Pseudoalteromonas sp. MSK9-3]|uniref:hypothetical protein n=1 Tax=Pseudoalteromonas sp. MSK9-3 TaxID=1897633 RepID=UPI000E6BA6F4|nr:hypothetical protein [Pseudoalteromonas sp. MSK9-3]RJE77097.1 hypothetical protein BGP78_10020 [Pseudoalteromonas sp. MSK9-3]